MLLRSVCGKSDTVGDGSSSFYYVYTCNYIAFILAVFMINVFANF